MSHIARYSTNLRDGQFLADALRSMGFTVEHHSTPQTMQMYGGQTATAEIIVHKASMKEHHFGSLGFTLQADGSYGLVADDLDIYAMNRLGGSFSKEGAWLETVTQAYGEQESIAFGVSEGWIFQGREIDEEGTVQLLWTVRE